MQVYHHELPLEEGFDILAKPKYERLVRGRQVNACSGIDLFVSLRGKPIRCWKCGCEADRWVVTKGRHDLQGHPVMNLFAWKLVPRTKKMPAHRELVMMTRDHVIPKFHGGSDVIANLRPGCEFCNHARGSNLSKEDRAFMEAHPELISPERLAASLARQEQAAQRKRELKEQRLAAQRAKWQELYGEAK